MNHPELISHLIALERYFEEGRQKAYSIRIHLEQVSAPAPSGDEITPAQAKLNEIINRRKKTFYKYTEPKRGGYQISP